MTDDTAALRERIEDLEHKLQVLDEGFAAEWASITEAIKDMTQRQKDFQDNIVAMFGRMAAAASGEQLN